MKIEAGMSSIGLRWSVLTLFPEMFTSLLSASLFGKAREKGLIEVDLVDYRREACGRHKVVDDAPFGGGAGMVIKVEPVARALSTLRQINPGAHIVLLTPQGRPFDQRTARRLSGLGHVVLVCGRYEGVDERIRSLVAEEISIGDYVLSGGEAAAWVVMDAVTRLVPGVVGQPESVLHESHGDLGMLEHPQYTRPRDFDGMRVPEVLFSGDHGAIAAWQRRQAILRTARRRPELLGRIELSEEERSLLEDLGLTG
ncbi:MAG TPA: tRNA (guanosine(37)-N1)-methyltransferase TrmD [Myxococcota bacterium]|nr:tRNA (guanosine(37)-N1)-methyltransferase TrmD [Myxococcota bacterium]